MPPLIPSKRQMKKGCAPQFGAHPLALIFGAGLLGEPTPSGETDEAEPGQGHRARLGDRFG